MAQTSSSEFFVNPVTHLQNLIRFDTTNPPGNEGPCIAYIKDVLESAAIPAQILYREPDRPNLVARIRGQGMAPPLLLYGHVDVVTAENQQWTYPPFEGRIAQGAVWGRGALDVKGGIAMMLSALIEVHRQQLPLAGDVILALVSDEETLGTNGSAYLVEEHAELFEGVKYAISEFGGFSLHVAGNKLYPIMVSEKSACWITATIRGVGGHASMPVQGGAVARAARFITLVDRHQLPLHLTTSTRLMFLHMADAIGGLKGTVLRQLTNPILAEGVLKLLGDQQPQFRSLLHNTVNVTGMHGSDKINVIPHNVTLELDGRLLPGFKTENLIDEIRALDPALTRDIEFDVHHFHPGPREPDMGLFHTLKSILDELDPDGCAIPMVLPAVTDARLFSQLGIQTYGYLPMQLPADYNFISALHGADERIPLEAVVFGTRAIYNLLQRFGEDA
jgi:acetylornithine deacetylase/succinyl-diaminopimelate desuccinylase-like protein